MSNILVWNCRGARKKGTRNYLHDLFLQHKLGLVGLLETGGGSASFRGGKNCGKVMGFLPLACNWKVGGGGVSLFSGNLWGLALRCLRRDCSGW
ncbi:hypothetical protein KSP40_PGU009791 [Platanthera guangdongensis]|uniref:Endonuclease/exonuclease/phosphatase n=1 Tax=Platanthera guangdongensis TaxID=2320717 RepID=A0ABR2LZV5_9ASPA